MTSGGIAFDGANNLVFDLNAEITQVIPVSALKPNTSYVLMLLYQFQAFPVSDGDLYFGLDKISGATKTVAGSAMITADQSYVVFRTRDSVEDDVLRIRRTSGTQGTLSVANVALFEMPKLVNSMFCLPMYGVAPTSQGHITPISRSQSYVGTITNDKAGVVQEYFARFTDTILPANGAGSESIADTVAT